MFIRETTKTAKGKKYFQYQLIESVRTPAGPRQRLVLNLGGLNVPREKWKELANCIEAELHNQPLLFESDSDIKNLASHYAQIIIREKLNQQAEEQTARQDREETGLQYEKVDIQSVSTSDARSMGAEQVVLSQMDQYNLDDILKELKFNESQRIHAKMLIAGRLIHPASERETVRWELEDSGISELLGTDINVYDNALHRTAVLLWQHHDKIEQKLAQAARKLFSLKETVILYDLTNTYFEGSRKNSTIAKHGHSKDKRRDRPLVTLALTIDEEGFPKHSRVLEGNISEPGTLEGMLEDLSSGTDGFTPQRTIVIDAGIATEENLKLITDKGFKYVAVSRKRTYADSFWETSTQKEIKLHDDKTKLKIKAVRTSDEVYLLCRSDAKAAKEKGIFELRIKKFEEALITIKDALGKKGTRKGYDTIRERIGRLKERFGVGSLYDIELRQEAGVVTKIKFKINPRCKARERALGEYVLRTNRLDFTDEEISKTHRSLSTVEDSFRSMKSHLGLRPNYHKRDDTSTAHIFITAIAYHILAGILAKLRSNGINYNWNTIRNILSRHERVTTAFNTENGDTLHIRTSTAPTVRQQNIYRNLQLKYNPLKQVQVRIPQKEKTGKSAAE
jgi:transposase